MDPRAVSWRGSPVQWKSSFVAVRVYTPHGGSLNYHPGTWSHRLFMMMEAILAWRTDLLLFESGYIADRFESLVGKPRHLAHVVRNGIAPRELEPVTPTPTRPIYSMSANFGPPRGSTR